MIESSRHLIPKGGYYNSFESIGRRILTASLKLFGVIALKKAKVALSLKADRGITSVFLVFKLDKSFFSRSLERNDTRTQIHSRKVTIPAGSKIS